MSRRIIGIAVAMMFTLAMILPTIGMMFGWIDATGWIILTVLAVSVTVLTVGLAPMFLEADIHA